MKPLLGFFFVTSLSGTLGFLLYMALSHIFLRSLSGACRYRMMKVCLLFYLFPFVLVKLHWDLNVRESFHPFRYFDLNGPVRTYLEDAIVKTASGTYLPGFTGRNRIIGMVYLVLAGLAVLYFCVQLVLFHRQNKHACVLDVQDTKLLNDLTETLHLRRNICRDIRLYQSSSAASPFTYGIRKPVIVLSANVSTPEATRLALLHELNHVRSHDSLFRLLAYLTLLLHFYNPFIYFFVREFVEVQEFACDEAVLKNLDDEDRRRYGYLLLQIASGLQPARLSPALHLSGKNKAFLKQRIRKIASPSSTSRVLSAVLVVACLMLPVLPVLAYAPVTLDFSQDDAITDADLSGADWVEFTPADELSEFESPDEGTFASFDIYFLSDDGSVYIPTANVLATPCRHHWICGQKKEHEPADEGCIVTVYDANYCSACHLIEKQSLNSTITYTSCTHKNRGGN